MDQIRGQECEPGVMQFEILPEFQLTQLRTQA